MLVKIGKKELHFFALILQLFALIFHFAFILIKVFLRTVQEIVRLKLKKKSSSRKDKKNPSSSNKFKKQAIHFDN